MNLDRLLRLRDDLVAWLGKLSPRERLMVGGAAADFEEARPALAHQLAEAKHDPSLVLLHDLDRRDDDRQENEQNYNGG